MYGYFHFIPFFPTFSSAGRSLLLILLESRQFIRKNRQTLSSTTSMSSKIPLMDDESRKFSSPRYSRNVATPVSANEKALLGLIPTNMTGKNSIVESAERLLSSGKSSKRKGRSRGSKRRSN